jgi:hypothetical protein
MRQPKFKRHFDLALWQLAATKSADFQLMISI